MQSVEALISLLFFLIISSYYVIQPYYVEDNKVIGYAKLNDLYNIKLFSGIEIDERYKNCNDYYIKITRYLQIANKTQVEEICI